MTFSCFVVCKVFASTLLSSLKQARSMLRQQRAALVTSSDNVVALTTNEQPQSGANVSQSDLSRLLSQYREAELQVGITNNRDVTEPAKICIRRMRISYEKSVGCGYGFVARSKFVSTSYYSYCDST